MFRFILSFILCFSLANPSHAFFEEVLEKFQEATLSFLANIKNTIEILEADYKGKLNDGKPELSEQFAKGLDQKLAQLKEKINKHIHHIESTKILSPEFKADIISKLKSFIKELEQKLEPPKKTPAPTEAAAPANPDL